MTRFNYKVVVGGVVHEPELSSQTKQHMGGRRKKDMNGAIAPSRSCDWSAHFMVAAEKVYASDRHERFYELQSS